LVSNCLIARTYLPSSNSSPRRALLAVEWLQESTRGLVFNTGDAYHVGIAILRTPLPGSWASPQGPNAFSPCFPMPAPKQCLALRCITEVRMGITKCYSSVLLRSRPIHCSSLSNTSHSEVQEGLGHQTHLLIQRHVPQYAYAISLVPSILSRMLQLAGCPDHAEMHNDAFG
jgi:hypothetical protein